jgi:hypothetical protein
MASRSYIFDGDKVSYPVPNTMDIVAYGSVRCWLTRFVKRGQDFSDWTIFLMYIDASNYIAAYGNAGLNSITVRYRVAGANFDLTFTPDAWDFDTWLDFGCSWGTPSGYLKAYWQGSLVGTAVPVTSTIAASDSTLYLGNWTTGQRPLLGRMDQFELYSSELPATEFSRFTSERFE